MDEKKDSYKQIFKSTSIVGGSQIINIAIGIVKTKVIALLLGPAGVGIAGIFQTIIEMVRNATGFGINFSGVKNIAQNNNNPQLVARAIIILRRWELGTGLFGTIIIIILCGVFSRYSFGNSSYTLSVAVVSVVLVINAVSAGQIAILQGLRRIGEMAKATLLGAILGTLISLPVYWWLGIIGIIPSMILTAVSSLIVSWWYARKIIIEPVHDLSLRQTFNEGLGMAKLGFFIVINGFMATLSMYIIRAIIMSHLGLDSVGLFQAVWTISTMYINILLNAMLADYFPRLSMLNNDNKASNKLINEQLEMTLLVGAPMLMGMVIFAPMALNLLYSSSFNSAIPVLKWQMAASFLTLIGWPLGVLYLSKNIGWLAILSEVLRQGIFISFILFGWKYWGFKTLGIGFLIANFFVAVFVAYSVRYINGFEFSAMNIRYIIFLGFSLAVILTVALSINGLTQYVINGTLLIITTIFCTIRLDNLLDIKQKIQSRFTKN